MPSDPLLHEVNRVRFLLGRGPLIAAFHLSPEELAEKARNQARDDEGKFEEEHAVKAELEGDVETVGGEPEPATVEPPPDTGAETMPTEQPPPPPEQPFDVRRELSPAGREILDNAESPDTSLGDDWRVEEVGDGFTVPHLWTYLPTGEKFVVKEAGDLSGRDALWSEAAAYQFLSALGMSGAPRTAENGSVSFSEWAGADDGLVRLVTLDDFIHEQLWSGEKWDEIVSKLVDPDDVLRMLLGDAAMGNRDRHERNVLIGEDSDGGLRLYPIDHAYADPRSPSGYSHFSYEGAMQVFLPQYLDYMAAQGYEGDDLRAVLVERLTEMREAALTALDGIEVGEPGDAETGNEDDWDWGDERDGRTHIEMMRDNLTDLDVGRLPALIEDVAASGRQSGWEPQAGWREQGDAEQPPPPEEEDDEGTLPASELMPGDIIDHNGIRFVVSAVQSIGLRTQIEGFHEEERDYEEILNLSSDEAVEVLDFTDDHVADPDSARMEEITVATVEVVEAWADRHGFTYDTWSTQDKVEIRGYDDSGEQAFRFERRMTSPTEAYNDYLTLAEQHQGRKLGSELDRELEALYRDMGVDTIRLQANIDVGAHSWARAGYGFDPSKTPPIDMFAVQQKADAIIAFIEDMDLDPDGELVSEWDEFIADFAQRLNGDPEGWPSPLELAMFGSDLRFEDADDRETWLGKAILTGPGSPAWMGVKYLTPVEQPPPPPEEDDEDKPITLDDMSMAFPDYIDQPRYYDFDDESFRSAYAAMADPDVEVPIYLAVPEDAEGIATGDTVTTSREHALMYKAPGERIVTARARAGDLVTDGNTAKEYEYTGEAIAAPKPEPAPEGTPGQLSAAGQRILDYASGKDEPWEVGVEWMAEPLTDEEGEAGGASEPYLWTNTETGERFVVKDKGTGARYNFGEEALQKEEAAAQFMQAMGLSRTPASKQNGYISVTEFAGTGDDLASLDELATWVGDRSWGSDEWEGIVAGLSDPDDVLRMALADAAMVNADRHARNVLIGETADGSRHLYPIDHNAVNPGQGVYNGGDDSMFSGAGELLLNQYLAGLAAQGMDEGEAHDHLVAKLTEIRDAAFDELDPFGEGILGQMSTNLQSLDLDQVADHIMGVFEAFQESGWWEHLHDRDDEDYGTQPPPPPESEGGLSPAGQQILDMAGSKDATEDVGGDWIAEPMVDEATGREAGASAPYLWTDGVTGERFIVKDRGGGERHNFGADALDKETAASEFMRAIGLDRTPVARDNGDISVIEFAGDGDDLQSLDTLAGWVDSVGAEEASGLVSSLSDPMEVLRLAVADAAMGNIDRHEKNVLVGETADGERHLYPIDHNLVRPDSKGGGPEWTLYGGAGELLLNQFLDWLAAENGLESEAEIEAEVQRLLRDMIAEMEGAVDPDSTGPLLRMFINLQWLDAGDLASVVMMAREKYADAWQWGHLRDEDWEPA